MLLLLILPMWLFTMTLPSIVVVEDSSSGAETITGGAVGIGWPFGIVIVTQLVLVALVVDMVAEVLG